MQIRKNFARCLLASAVLYSQSAIALEIGLPEKIGQMIMVGFTGADKNSSGFKTIEKQIEKSEIGGVIYLKRNIRSKKAVVEMNTILSSVGPKLPPFIAVDQEGGRVQRLLPKIGFPSTPSAKSVASRKTHRQAYEIYNILASNLSNMGFNMNFGPVVDLDLYAKNPIIGRLERSFSSDPEIVLDYATAFIAAHKDNHVVTALKHFPGHGSSRSDTHKGFVDISKTWSAKELEPYRELIKSGEAQLVMSGHLYNEKIQGEGKKHPASLSSILLKKKLRGELEFGGIIVSDDMQMGAIEKNYSFKDSVIRAVKAGNNIILFSNDKKPNPNLPYRIRDILIEASETDADLLEDIQTSYERIKRMKIFMLPDAKLDRMVTKSIGKSKDFLLLTPEYMAQMTRDVKLTPTVKVSIN